ncbi:hypothetical protein ACFW81_02485 [Streptomyces angustmyceticus]|uniref:hypothetical protein n=1 Tax=Streptomyces angustmyceticus TaxID=285578 RepID=UPI0036C786CC
MAIYRLTSGHRVRTTDVEGGKEFETKNPEGETISTVVLPAEEARELISLLSINNALRFAEEFGAGVA